MVTLRLDELLELLREFMEADEERSIKDCVDVQR
jgi:hypothetical protein